MSGIRRNSLGGLLAVALLMVGLASPARADDRASTQTTGLPPGYSSSLGYYLKPSVIGGLGEMNWIEGSVWLRSDHGLESGRFGYIGGIATSDPDVAMWPNHSAAFPGGMVETVFARGGDNALWWRSMVDMGTMGGQQLSGWMTLGGLLSSGPGAAASKDSSTLAVFARGLDNGLWYRTTTNGSSWSPWQTLGGILTSDPDVSANATNGGFTVVARGADEAAWMRSSNGSTWGEWTPLGGQLTSGPSISFDLKSFHVAARGTTYEVYVRDNTAGSWSQWLNLGGYAVSDPNIAVVDYDAAGWDTPNGNPVYNGARPISPHAYNKTVVAKAPDGAFWVNVWPTPRGLVEAWSGWFGYFIPS